MGWARMLILFLGLPRSSIISSGVLAYMKYWCYNSPTIVLGCLTAVLCVPRASRLYSCLYVIRKHTPSSYFLVPLIPYRMRCHTIYYLLLRYCMYVCMYHNQPFHGSFSQPAVSHHYRVLCPVMSYLRRFGYIDSKSPLYLLPVKMVKAMYKFDYILLFQLVKERGNVINKWYFSGK